MGGCTGHQQMKTKRCKNNCPICQKKQNVLITVQPKDGWIFPLGMQTWADKNGQKGAVVKTLGWKSNPSHKIQF